MAFRVVKEWTETRSPIFLIIQALGGIIRAFGYKRSTRRILAVILTLATHIMVMLLIYNFTIPNVNWNQKAKPSLKVNLFNLNDESEQEEEKPIIKKQIVEPIVRPFLNKDSQNIDTIADIPREWSTSIISLSQAGTDKGASNITAKDDRLIAICASGEINVLANDSDKNGGVLSIAEVQGGMGAIIKEQKIIVQTAYTGKLSYTVENNHGERATAIIHIENKCS